MADAHFATIASAAVNAYRFRPVSIFAASAAGLRYGTVGRLPTRLPMHTLSKPPRRYRVSTQTNEPGMAGFTTPTLRRTTKSSPQSAYHWGQELRPKPNRHARFDTWGDCPRVGGSDLGRTRRARAWR